MMKTTTRRLVRTLCCVCAIAAPASAWAPSDDGERQFELLDAISNGMSTTQEIEALRTLVTLNPKSGPLWDRLAGRLLISGRHDEAIAAYVHCIELRYYPGEAHYNTACCHALEGRLEPALVSLEASIGDRFNEFHALMRRDSDLNSLRDDPRFNALVHTEHPGEVSRDEGWCADLRALHTIIEQFHYDHDTVRPDAELDVDIEDLIQRVPEMTNRRIVAEITRVLAMVGDCHTNIIYPTSGPHELRAFPLAMRTLNDGVYVLAAGPDHADVVSQRVVSVNDLPIEEAMRRMRVMVSEDHGSTVQFDYETVEMMTFAEMMLGAGLADDVNHLTIEVEDTDGERTSAKFTSVPISRLDSGAWVKSARDDRLVQTCFQRPGEPYWVTTLRDDEGVRDVVYCHVRSVREKSRGDMREFAKRVINEVVTDDTQAFVLDLRFNGGGSSDLVWPFVYLLAMDERINDPDRLFVITGHRTSSAAALFASFLRYHTNATFVGTSPNEPPNFTGEGARFTLPWSGLELVVSSRYFQSVCGTRDVRTHIEPDIRIERGIEDVIERRDPVLDTVLARVRGK